MIALLLVCYPRVIKKNIIPAAVLFSPIIQKIASYTGAICELPHFLLEVPAGFHLTCFRQK